MSPAPLVQFGASPMTDPAVLSALADAIKNAGATEEIVAALMNVGGTFERAPRSKGGRPRKYADRALRDRAYRERKKARDETSAADQARDETYDEIDRADHGAARGGDETRGETPRCRAIKSLPARHRAPSRPPP